ncbi:MAG: hypothetical protein FGM24_05525 [Candidatus Kapabacteria bacterium]|nr:hypothetical protein [Candidatus Kapabacteria bacterium]
MRTTVILLALIIAPWVMKGQGKYLGSVDDTKRHAEQVVGLMAKGEFDKMASIAGMIWHASPESFDRMRKSLVGSIPDLVVEHGPIIDHDHLTVQKFGSTLLRHVFILRFTRSPARIRVNYYQSTKGWILVGASMETDVDRILDAAEQKAGAALPIPILPGAVGPGK